MPTSTVSLPLPLLLLVHLYILDYPSANDPEYDQDLFNPRVRGLRDRARSMEDILYFLVGCLEGGRVGAKLILPTYPCCQPSDIVAFRISVCKYLESLRHGSLYGSVTKERSNKVKEVAWWWRDIVVRKTLFEECSGEKFERILLAVSTHVFFQRSSGSPPDRKAIVDLLRTQPSIYVRRLHDVQLSRCEWVHHMNTLTQRLSAANEIRIMMGSRKSVNTKHQTLPTQELVLMAENMQIGIVGRHWSTNDGRICFRAMLSAARLETKVRYTDQKGNPSTTVSEKFLIPDPLPVAAAHHPVCLRRLKAVAESLSMDKMDESRSHQPSHHLSPFPWNGELDNEKSRAQALQNSLKSVKAAGERLKMKWKTKDAKFRDHLWGTSSRIRLWRPNGSVPDPEMRNKTLTAPSTIHSYIYNDHIDRILEALPGYPALIDGKQLRLPAIDIRSHLASHCARSGSDPSDPDPVPFKDLMSSLVNDFESTLHQSRFSITRSRRFISQSSLLDEIDRLVDDACNTSSEQSPQPLEMASFETPKKRAPAVNRIWTSGTPKPSTVRKVNPAPRDSFPMEALLEPAISLPTLTSLSSNLFEEQVIVTLADDEDESTVYAEQPGRFEGDNDRRNTSAILGSHSQKQSRSLDNNDGFQESHGVDDPASPGGFLEDQFDEDYSMTLHDILLHTDVSHYDLLSPDADDGGPLLLSEQSVIWD